MSDELTRERFRDILGGTDDTPELQQAMLDHDAAQRERIIEEARERRYAQDEMKILRADNKALRRRIKAAERSALNWETFYNQKKYTTNLEKRLRADNTALREARKEIERWAYEDGLRPHDRWTQICAVLARTETEKP